MTNTHEIFGGIDCQGVDVLLDLERGLSEELGWDSHAEGSRSGGKMKGRRAVKSYMSSSPTRSIDTMPDVDLALSQARVMQDGAAQYYCPEENCHRRLGLERPFSSIKLLKQHFLIRHSNVRFDCDLCGRNFGLARHYRAHRAECVAPLPAQYVTCHCFMRYGSLVVDRSASQRQAVAQWHACTWPSCPSSHFSRTQAFYRGSDRAAQGIPAAARAH